MPKKRVTETTVYQFDELSDEAKEKAREWYRQGNVTTRFWSECTIDDAKEIGKLLGMDIDNIYFSGFWSQGDGACFEGTWRAGDIKLDKLKEYAPQDKELHRIGEQLAELAVKYPDGYFLVKHRGHYSHSGCTSFDVELPNDQEEEFEYDSPEYKALQVELGEDEDSLINIARDFMDWIYKQLEKEWDYQNSDEQVEESIRCNAYEFLETGERA
jgi:hypothetical protein